MPEKNYPQVTISQTEVRLLSSALVGQDYSLLIAKPEDYDESQNAYPVLYVLDANWHFGLYTQIVRTMQIFQEVPELLIVGIAYPTEIEGDLWALRTRDYTPTEDKVFVESFTESYKLPMTRLPQASGGAEKFLSFIQQELMPFVKSNYRIISKAQMLVGWSFGGLFALYSLFQQPNIFSRYLVLSPSIWWDDDIILGYEESFAGNNTQLSAKLFLSIGDSEGDTMVSSLHELTGILQKREYRGLELTKVVLAGETHLSVVGSAFTKGIRTLCDQ
jgi:predicted alpha/beta superfamily hydrolase